MKPNDNAPKSAEANAKPAEPAKQTAQAVAGIPEGTSLEKVRDLLFGAQIKETDRKRKDLDERLTNTLAEMRSETSARFDELSRELKKELAALKEGLGTEKSVRERNGEELAQKLEQSSTQLTKQLNSESKRIAQHIEDTHAAILEHVTQVAGTMEDAKTDRRWMARMLNQVANQLDSGDMSDGQK